MSSVTDWIAALSTLVSTIATIVIAFLTYKTIHAYKEQIKLAQEQVTIGQEQKFNDARPVLVPSSQLNSLKLSDGTPSLAFGTSQTLFFDGLKNIGKGPALNIHGIFFPSIDHKFPPQNRQVFWNQAAISFGESTQNQIVLGRGIQLNGTEEIAKGCSLYAPSSKKEIGIEVRLTLTYHDVFGRKHASIYDYSSQRGWLSKGHFPGITLDLWEADDATDMARQNHEAYLRAKQTAQP